MAWGKPSNNLDILLVKDSVGNGYSINWKGHLAYLIPSSEILAYENIQNINSIVINGKIVSFNERVFNKLGVSKQVLMLGTKVNWDVKTGKVLSYEPILIASKASHSLPSDASKGWLVSSVFISKDGSAENIFLNTPNFNQLLSKVSIEDGGNRISLKEENWFEEHILIDEGSLLQKELYFAFTVEAGNGLFACLQPTIAEFIEGKRYHIWFPGTDTKRLIRFKRIGEEFKALDFLTIPNYDVEDSFLIYQAFNVPDSKLNCYVHNFLGVLNTPYNLFTGKLTQYSSRSGSNVQGIISKILRDVSEEEKGKFFFRTSDHKFLYGNDFSLKQWLNFLHNKLLEFEEDPSNYDVNSKLILESKVRLEKVPVLDVEENKELFSTIEIKSGKLILQELMVLLGHFTVRCILLRLTDYLETPKGVNIQFNSPMPYYRWVKIVNSLNFRVCTQLKPEESLSDQRLALHLFSILNLEASIYFPTKSEIFSESNKVALPSVPIVHLTSSIPRSSTWLASKRIEDIFIRKFRAFEEGAMVSLYSESVSSATKAISKAIILKNLESYSSSQLNRFKNELFLNLNVGLYNLDTRTRAYGTRVDSLRYQFEKFLSSSNYQAELVVYNSLVETLDSQTGKFSKNPLKILINKDMLGSGFLIPWGTKPALKGSDLVFREINSACIASRSFMLKNIISKLPEEKARIYVSLSTDNSHGNQYIFKKPYSPAYTQFEEILDGTEPMFIDIDLSRANEVEKLESIIAHSLTYQLSKEGQRRHFDFIIKDLDSFGNYRAFDDPETIVTFNFMSLMLSKDIFSGSEYKVSIHSVEYSPVKIEDSESIFSDMVIFQRYRSFWSNQKYYLVDVRKFDY